ncbi:hypothetical protein TNIN_199411 [Trichonephila inaurata madagascariensis]|uniref:Uncharacterized protein n=1 Tax=Trichonephila inaurata madagascariensis TaxID=2747483 RepID=A0A8X6YB05_9ARAC|nr:hypothetical protein TNIN_199411 [Trichonephila inaurata madagascariensis]
MDSIGDLSKASMKTEKASNTVTPRAIFSPESGGRQKTNSVSTDITSKGLQLFPVIRVFSSGQRVLSKGPVQQSNTRSDNLASSFHRRCRNWAGLLQTSCKDTVTQFDMILYGVNS